MEKWGFRLSKKEVLETIVKTKYPHHSEEEFLVSILSFDI
jgi:hypothetical protein